MRPLQDVTMDPMPGPAQWAVDGGRAPVCPSPAFRAPIHSRPGCAGRHPPQASCR
jgi:hypothetical protein